IQTVTGLAEDPASALVAFSKREEVGGDVLFASGKALLSGGKLVHKGKAEVMFFAGEIDGGKSAAAVLTGFPADLAAKAGRVASGLHVAEFAEELEKNGFDEIPIFGAAGEETAERINKNT